MNYPPSLNEWRHQNPGKSINEYYKLISEHEAKPPAAPPVQFYPVQNGSSPDLSTVGVIGSVIGIVAYFMPFVHVAALGGILSLKGASARRLTDVDDKSVVLIICPLVMLFGAVAKSRAIELVGYIPYVAVLVWMGLNINNLNDSNEPSFSLFGNSINPGVRLVFDAGYYLAWASVAIILFDIFQPKPNRSF